MLAKTLSEWKVVNERKAQGTVFTRRPQCDRSGDVDGEAGMRLLGFFVLSLEAECHVSKCGILRIMSSDLAAGALLQTTMC